MVLGVTILFKWPKDFTSYEYIFMRINYNITNSNIHTRIRIFISILYYLIIIMIP